MTDKGKPGGRAPGIDPANKKRGPRSSDTPAPGDATRTNGTSGGSQAETDPRRLSAPAEPPGAPPSAPSRSRDH